MTYSISKLRQIQLIIALAIGMVVISFLFLTALSADTVRASSQNIKQEQTGPALQATAIPTVTLVSTPTLTSSLILTSSSSYSISFAGLGYGESSLESPLGQANFNFSFPEDWAAT